MISQAKQIIDLVSIAESAGVELKRSGRITEIVNARWNEYDNASNLISKRSINLKGRLLS